MWVFSTPRGSSLQNLSRYYLVMMHLLSSQSSLVKKQQDYHDKHPSVVWLTTHSPLLPFPKHHAYIFLGSMHTGIWSSLYMDRYASIHSPSLILFHPHLLKQCLHTLSHNTPYTSSCLFSSLTHSFTTGKCVGEKNLIVFYVFVSSLLAFLFFVVILLVIFFVDIFTALRS